MLEASVIVSSDDLTININKLDTIPIHIYFKDKEGVYCGRNYYAAEQMHKQNFEPEISKDFVLAKTDYDLFDYKIARQFRTNDQQILKKNRPIQFIEKFILPTGGLKNLLSIKTPIRCLDDRSFLLGLTIDLNELPIHQAYQKISLVNCILNKKNLKEKFINLMANYSKSLLDEVVYLLQQLPVYYSDLPQLQQLVLISERQLQCLCFLCRGYSSKQIGQFLGISHRTIEIFIDQLKVKLTCYNKSQLADWLWNLLSNL